MDQHTAYDAGLRDHPATSSSLRYNVVLEVELGRVKRVVVDVGSIEDPVRNSGDSPDNHA